MIDKDLQQHVQNALDWEPSVNAKDIGVSVDEGVVTLRGNVDSYTAVISGRIPRLRRRLWPVSSGTRWCRPTA
jgi:hypothetical protein